MNKHPLVSVIIPTYNRAKYVSAAIRSVLDQSYKAIETIVIDDGSTDNTPDILSDFGDRIHSIRQENQGVSAARNRGIKAAKGEMIAFLDSDDLWLPDKLERQVTLMSAKPNIPCCLCNIKLVYADGNVDTSFNLSWLHPTIDEGIWLNPLDMIATRFLLFNQAVLIRRTILDKIGLFNESYKYMEDYDLAMRLAFLQPWLFINEPLVIWHGGSSDSLTEQAKRHNLDLSKTIYEMYERLFLLAQKHGVSKKQMWLLNSQLNKRKIRYQADQLLAEPSPLKQLLGLCLKKMEKAIDKLYWYSPWYPRIQVTPI